MKENRVQKYERHVDHYFTNIQEWAGGGLIYFAVYFVGTSPIYMVSQMLSVWFTNKLDILTRYLFFITIAWVVLVNIRYILFYYYLVCLWISRIKFWLTNAK